MILGGIDMKKSFREKIRPWLLKNNNLYKIAKLGHKSYSNLTSNLHVLPDFLIIGAAKGGTSSLYDYLIQHPQINSCVVKEPNYFTEYYSRGLSWYKSCFPFSITTNNSQTKKIITGEATARYYWYPHAPKRAKQLLPNAKIILLLRNPIDRAYSDYQMKFRNGVETNSFEKALDVEEKILENEWEKMLEDENYFSLKFTVYGYKIKGKYLEFIKNWKNFFPSNQLLIIKSEDFFKNPQEKTNDVLNFLNLEPMKLEHYSVTRKGNYERMKPDTRKMLLDYFKPFNQELYKYLGMDFGWE